MHARRIGQSIRIESRIIRELYPQAHQRLSFNALRQSQSSMGILLVFRGRDRQEVIPILFLHHFYPGCLRIGTGTARCPSGRHLAHGILFKVQAGLL